MPAPHSRPDLAGPLAVEEFRALRATIRERGTARLVISTFTFVAWATLLVAVEALLPTPGATLIPLVVLIAGFEVIFALHVGVERVGRYLQVYYEDALAGLPAWEGVIMKIGPPAAGPATGLDPLLPGLFVVSAVLNFVPAATLTLNSTLEGGSPYAGLPVELAVYGVLHLVFVARVIQARRFSGRLRQSDLERFQKNYDGQT